MRNFFISIFFALGILQLPLISMQTPLQWQEEQLLTTQQLIEAVHQLLAGHSPLPNSTLMEIVVDHQSAQPQVLCFIPVSASELILRSLFAVSLEGILRTEIQDIFAQLHKKNIIFSNCLHYKELLHTLTSDNPEDAVFLFKKLGLKYNDNQHHLQQSLLKYLKKCRSLVEHLQAEFINEDEVLFYIDTEPYGILVDAMSGHLTNDQMTALVDAGKSYCSKPYFTTYYIEGNRLLASGCDLEEWRGCIHFSTENDSFKYQVLPKFFGDQLVLALVHFCITQTPQDTRPFMTDLLTNNIIFSHLGGYPTEKSFAFNAYYKDKIEAPRSIKHSPVEPSLDMSPLYEELERRDSILFEQLLHREHPDIIPISTLRNKTNRSIANSLAQTIVYIEQYCQQMSAKIRNAIKKRDEFMRLPEHYQSPTTQRPRCPELDPEIKNALQHGKDLPILPFTRANNPIAPLELPSFDDNSDR